MADQPMSDADYAAYQPYVEEIIALINQQIRRHPDPKVLEAAWRVGFVTVLTEMVRGYRLLPDQVERYLSRVCEVVIADTWANVRNWDAAGPRQAAHDEPVS